MRLPKRLVTTLAAALSPFLPHSAKPSAAPSVEPSATEVIRDDHIDDIEIDTAMGAFHRAELDAKYAGPHTTLDAQLAAMFKARGKGLRYVNSCLSGGAELARFVADRTRDDV